MASTIATPKAVGAPDGVGRNAVPNSKPRVAPVIPLAFSKNQKSKRRLSAANSGKTSSNPALEDLRSSVANITPASIHLGSVSPGSRDTLTPASLEAPPNELNTSSAVVMPPPPTPRHSSNTSANPLSSVSSDIVSGPPTSSPTPQSHKGGNTVDKIMAGGHRAEYPAAHGMPPMFFPHPPGMSPPDSANRITMPPMAFPHFPAPYEAGLAAKGLVFGEMRNTSPPHDFPYASGPPLPPTSFAPMSMPPAGPHFPPNGPMPINGSLPEFPFVPAFVPAPVANGVNLSRSASQSSSQPYLTEHVPMPHPPPHFAQFLGSDGRQVASGLAEYIGTQFNRPEFADCLLLVQFPLLGDEVHIPAHALVISQSPYLRSILLGNNGQCQSSMDGRKILNFSVHDKNITPQAFTFALGMLYGNPIPDFRGLDFNSPPGNTPETFANLSVQMRRILAFIASATFLGLESLALQGVHLAVSVLHTENVEVALEFALSGGVAFTWAPEPQPGSLLSGPGHRRAVSSLGEPIYGRPSGFFLSKIVDWLAMNFPSDLYLNVHAPILQSHPRIPTSPTDVFSVSGDLGNTLQFGDLAIEEAAGFSEHTTFSSILLSLPFAALKVLFEHKVLAKRMGFLRMVEVMRAVVEERERRRKRALRNKSRDYDGTAEQWEEVSWEERLEPNQNVRGAFELIRGRAAEDDHEDSESHSTPVKGA